MRDYWSIPHYSQPTVRELQQKAAASVKREKAKGRTLEPVIIQGRKIATTWWGQAWCDNLERYSDYSNRLPRGKRYVKNGSVIDLKIEKGKVRARVQGTRSTPYKIEIDISPLSEERAQAIVDKCAKKIENIESLLSGNIPDEMKEIFLSKDGLFPSPKEIDLNCSCPDWAYMCKHVAAALYGVGARLDKDPMLFFELRGIDASSFVDVTLANRVENMLAHASDKSPRVMDEISANSLFASIWE